MQSSKIFKIFKIFKNIDACLDSKTYMSKRHRKPAEKREKTRKGVGVETQNRGMEGYASLHGFCTFMCQETVASCSGPKKSGLGLSGYQSWKSSVALLAWVRLKAESQLYFWLVP